MCTRQLLVEHILAGLTCGVQAPGQATHVTSEFAKGESCHHSGQVHQVHKHKDKFREPQ